MSKAVREMMEQVKGDQQIGAVEAAVEGVKAVAPGLSLGKILSDIGNELKEQASFGAHELAAGLFRGDSFVMYPRQNQDSPDHGLPEMQQEQDRGGRDM